MADIEKILRKRKPTGEELGIVDLTFAARSMRQHFSEDDMPTAKDWDKLQARVNKLSGTEQEPIYFRYVDIHTWILRKYNYNRFALASAFSGLRSIAFIIGDILTCEEIDKYIESLHLSEDAPKLRLSCAVSLDDYAPENPNSEKYKRDIEENRLNLDRAIKFCLFFNAQISILAELCKIPELKAFRMDLSQVYQVAENYNYVRSRVEELIQHREDPVKRESHLKALHECFAPIELMAADALSEKQIDVAREVSPIFDSFIKGTLDGGINFLMNGMVTSLVE